MENLGAVTLTQGRRLVNSDGTTNISCRQCGRVIAKVRSPQFTTVSSCAICEGAPEEAVLPQYYQQSPMHMPMPRIAAEKDVTTMYEDESAETAKGKFGWLRPMFKVTSWLGAPKVVTAMVSKAVAKRKKKASKGLLAPYNPEVEE